MVDVARNLLRHIEPPVQSGYSSSTILMVGEINGAFDIHVPSPTKLFDLSSKVAIITGGNQGIGWGMATALADAGAAVVIPANRNQERGAEAAEILTSTGATAFAVGADVAVAADVQRLVDLTLERFGRLDILVNNAGIVPRVPLIEMSEAEWDEVMAINLKGAWLCSRAAGRIMVARGTGRIINVSSLNAVRASNTKGFLRGEQSRSIAIYPGTGC